MSELALHAGAIWEHHFALGRLGSRFDRSGESVDFEKLAQHVHALVALRPDNPPGEASS